MTHQELNKSRIINMLDDTRRYLLKARQDISNDEHLYRSIKATINFLEVFSKMVHEDDERMIPFDGVFFLKKSESESFRIRYKAHMAGGPCGPVHSTVTRT